MPILKLALPTLLFSLLLLAPASLAAQIQSQAFHKMDQNEVYFLSTVTLTAETDSEITQEHGINLLLDEYVWVLWQESQPLLGGTAVEAGRMAALPEVTYLNGHKALHLSVAQDFLAGESVTINNLQLRTYEDGFGKRYLGLDVNGDMIADFNDVNPYEVNNDTSTDHTPPYPVEELTYSLSDSLDSVTLTWQSPPDYDVTGFTVERKLDRGGNEGVFQLVLNGFFVNEYVDEDVQEGESITYKVYANDSRNNGEATEVIVSVASPEQEPPQEPDKDQPPADEEEGDEETPDEDSNQDPQPQPDTQELAELSKLLNYYKIRYQIKCLPGGVPAYWGNGFCLWAKINLAYAQEKLSQPDIVVEFTDQQKTVMKSRLVYSRARHQANCVEAATPADYCSALGKALMRAEYFLEQWGLAQ